MKIKVNYSNKTGMVLGYYPNYISYKKIPEPYIEITKAEYQANFGKDMIVRDEIYQEDIKTEEVITQGQRDIKISQINQYYDSREFKEESIKVRGKIYQVVNDTKFRSLILSKIVILQNKLSDNLVTEEQAIFSLEIKEGLTIDLNLKELKEILFTLDDIRQAGFKECQNHQKNIRALKSKQDVENYKIN